jgi:sulfhydrogenase subunit delta
MFKKLTKPRVGIVGLTSCEGCQFAIMDLGNAFLELMQDVEIVQFRLIEEKVFVVPKMDICFVEGSAVTKANEKIIKEIRNQTKFLIALGDCAALGGIHQIKNYHQPQELLKEIYFHGDKIDNPDILNLDKIVKVDYVLPGCPINNLEFFRLIYSLIRDISYKIRPRPVCEECQIKGYPCVLMKKPSAADKKGLPRAASRGEMCFGPIIQGGCNAICLKSQMPCQGCRGIYKGAQIENHLRHLEGIGYTKEEINHQLEIYGLRDEVEH